METFWMTFGGKLMAFVLLFIAAVLAQKVILRLIPEGRIKRLLTRQIGGADRS